LISGLNKSCNSKVINSTVIKHRLHHIPLPKQKLKVFEEVQTTALSGLLAQLGVILVAEGAALLVDEDALEVAAVVVVEALAGNVGVGGAGEMAQIGSDGHVQ
jgi:hypothetical protein